MTLRTLLLAAVLSTCFSFNADAQYKWEVGFKMGASNYLGDIGGYELPRRDFVWDMHLDDTRMNYALFVRRKLNKKWSLGFNTDYISIWGFDANSLNPPRVARNANFRNRIFEVGGRAEYTLFYDSDVGGRGYYNPDFHFYVFAGLAGYYHNPQSQIFEGAAFDDASNTYVKIEPDYNGSEWYDTRPLRTENQEEEYSKFGLAIPVGGGVRFTFNKSWRFGWELNWRTLFTDYIDDVSTQYGDIDQIAERGSIAEALAQQSSIATVAYANSLPTDVDNGVTGGGSLNSHQWAGYEINDAGEEVPVFTKKGDSTHNDSYLTMAFTAGYVIRGTSSFYKAKYSWIK